MNNSELRAQLAEAVAAGEPVAWIVESPKDLEPVTSVCKHKDQADRFKSMRWTVTPVYAAPPAAAHGDEAVAQEPKKETVCRNCFRNPEQIAKCLSYDCNVYEREAVSAMRAQGDGE